MTTEQFQTLMNDIAFRLRRNVTYLDERAIIGDHEFELHRSGILRHSRYVYPTPDAERIAEGIRLEETDQKAIR